ncbi:MAG: hypothetical protein ACT4OO_02600 [Nitrospiraceae bacterium]
MTDMGKPCGRVTRLRWMSAETVLPALILLLLVLSPEHILSADKIAGTLSVKDVLAMPGQPARIEAKLVRIGLVGETGLGGEKLELVIEGKVAATAMTGGDGRAFFEYKPTMRGNHTMTVRVASNTRVTSSETTATLAAWERRRSILFVEMAALVEESKIPLISVPAISGLARPSELVPVPDAANELTRLTQFYYNVAYLAWLGKDSSPAISQAGDIRDWLRTHKFPLGLAIAVNPGQEALGQKLDELKAGGWTVLKAGIGRTRAFAEVLIEHRIEVVIVPEPTRGDLPRKAKVAKDWKEVRKKL